MLVVVPKAVVSVKSHDRAPPPCNGYVVFTFLVVGTAPIVLYEIVTAAEPLYVPPLATPAPPLFTVNEFRFEPSVIPEIVLAVRPSVPPVFERPVPNRLLND